ncbi:MAG: cyclic nucleotide-binding domain-containing protein [Rubrivivax sp.]|jgi:CRP/FNR family cyclic AMP-dependent transcriptional regulator
MHWAVRAAQVGALPANATSGTALLAQLWASDSERFDDAALQRLAPYLQFVAVRGEQRLILQDEPGDFMLVLLEGRIRVERITGGPRVARLAEARPGDVLGEMALLDAGPRASDCVTQGPCLLAVLETEALLRLMQQDAPLALVLLAGLARRLSLRLRQVSTRLSTLLTDT